MFCLYVAVCGSYSFAVFPLVLDHVYTIHGGVNYLNSVPYSCYMYLCLKIKKKSPLVPLDSCLTVAACLSSA